MKRKSVFRFSMVATPIMIACGLLVTGSSAWADDAVENKCTNRTLLGDYGFAIEGVFPATPGAPINWLRGVAMGHFDGKGNYTQVDHVVVNGTPPPAEWTFGSGPYTVNPNCTGTLVINIPGNPFSPVRIHFVIVRQGKEVRFVVDSSATSAVGIRVE